MPTVVGVRLRFSKTLWFDSAGLEPVEGDIVIVETERGQELGQVVRPPWEVETSDLPAPLKPLIRIADDSDLDRADELLALEREALPVFRSLIEEHKLDMKPVNVEYLLDGDKIIFYFSAEERVDFRNLVKDLAARFHARIDMRQVGVRDEARMVGGLGHCGQMLCCVRFGGEFQPVSIRMAKEQDLPLNPLKISGLCGRLMCCLRYEYDAYKDFKSRAPKRGAFIDTPVGVGKVMELNTPKETIRLSLEGESLTIPLASMGCGKGGTCPCHVDTDALIEAGARSVAVAIEEEPMSAPAPKPTSRREPRREPKRESKGEPKGQPKGGSKSGPKAEQPQAAGDAPAAPARKRRRRGRGSGGQQDGSAGAQGAAQGSGEATKPAEQGSGAQSAGEGAEGRSGGRRRRRRKPKGSGGGAAAE